LSAKNSKKVYVSHMLLFIHASALTHRHRRTQAEARQRFIEGAAGEAARAVRTALKASSAAGSALRWVGDTDQGFWSKKGSHDTMAPGRKLLHVLKRFYYYRCLSGVHAGRRLPLGPKV
jgi:alkylated DNA repair dioxygenase AlkB